MGLAEGLAGRILGSAVREAGARGWTKLKAMHGHFAGPNLEPSPYTVPDVMRGLTRGGGVLWQQGASL